MCTYLAAMCTLFAILQQNSKLVSRVQWKSPQDKKIQQGQKTRADYAVVVTAFLLMTCVVYVIFSGRYVSTTLVSLSYRSQQRKLKIKSISRHMFIRIK